MASTVLTAALEQMVGSGLTTAPIDNAKAVLIVRAAEASGDRKLGLRLVLEARRNHRTWLGRTQRSWQQKTRRPGRAVHDDSIAIREKYVRCR